MAAKEMGRSLIAKQMVRHCALLVLTGSLLTIAGCSGVKTSDRGSATKGEHATITAVPNPIRVCDGTGLGVTKLSWTSVGPDTVEVHVSSPDGELFARTIPTGTSETAKWVADGMIFFLQDVSGGKPLTPENTLATVAVKVNNAGCQ